MGNISKLSDILSEIVFDEKSKDRSVKQAVAFGFWRDIAGCGLSKFSTPYGIKGKTLFVSVKNPQVMQELLFQKNALLRKISNYFLPLNIQIEDIRYDYKSWGKVTGKNVLLGEEDARTISADEIEKISLNKGDMDDIEKIKTSISKLSFLNDEQKEKYSKNITNSIKAKKLRNGADIDR